MLTDAAKQAEEAEAAGAVPPDTGRAVSRLGGSTLGRKQQRLTHKSPMPARHAPKRRTRPGALVTESEFEQMRQDVFARAGQLCERCGRHRDAVGVLHAHHRQLLSRGGEDRRANLASLCPECHTGWAHKEVRAATGLGFIVPSRFDPARRAMQLYDQSWVLLGDDGTYAWRGDTEPGENDID
jgi:hypothetical protein